MAKSTNEEIARRIKYLVNAHDKWRPLKCLNMDAAGSQISPEANDVLKSDISRRHLPLYQDKFLAEITAILEALGKKLFRADYVEFRPPTTSTADGLAIRCLTQRDEDILALEKPWGHATWREIGYAGMQGLKVHDISFDRENWNVNMNGLARLAEKIKPKLMIVGLACFLFPHPLREIRKIADETNARVWYDGAHPLGLIAGGAFQDPLGEGADLLTGSSQKTLSGPMGGLMIHNNEELCKKINSVFKGHLASVGEQRFAALAITFAEWLQFGRDFATQIINNAKALAEALDYEGVPVLFKHLGYTKSHTILFDADDLGGSYQVAEKLRRANIVVWPYPHYDIKDLIRLGTTEMTRYGMKESDMKEIARFFRRVVIDDEAPGKISDEVADFRSSFARLHYCFG